MRADPKDVMLAILAATASLAGLVLVFSGFLVTQSLVANPDSVSDRYINKFRIFAKIGAVPFVLSFLSGSCAFAWLLSPWWLYYEASVYLFTAVGLVTAIYGLAVLFFLI